MLVPQFGLVTTSVFENFARINFLNQTKPLSGNSIHTNQLKEIMKGGIVPNTSFTNGIKMI
jgi:hypothetical protein